MRALSIQVAWCLAIVAAVGEFKKCAWAQVVPTYELYSWETSKGSWNFYLTDTTNRQKTPEEVFSEKTALHGMEQLKRKMAKLPRGSRIVWFDRLTLKGVSVRGSEPLKYPPKETVDEVRRFAHTHRIELAHPPD